MISKEHAKIFEDFANKMLELHAASIAWEDGSITDEELKVVMAEVDDHQERALSVVQSGDLGDEAADTLEAMRATFGHDLKGFR